MALGDFTHIVVGSVEAFYLVFAGELAWVDYWLVFAVPTLAGNIVGGSFIFALISHAQVRSDVELQEARREERQARLAGKESRG
ncbi:Inner membrane protein YfdC [compost metagenome]